VKGEKMNRNIIITGANNGIGLAMTKALLEMGDRVAALDLSLENLGLSASNLLPFVCNVTGPVRIQSVVDEVIHQLGGVDILINNACLALFTPFEQRTLEDIHREFEVNYYGYLNMIRAVLPVMTKQGHGVVHNFSSGVGFTGMPGMIGYTSSKGAIEAMTRTLALEYAPQGITFNVMHPPLTRTKSAAGFGMPPEMMADPKVVGRGMAKLVGMTKPVLVPGIVNSIQLWMSYHMRVQMGRMMSMMADKARKNEVAVVPQNAKEVLSHFDESSQRYEIREQRLAEE
jgi:NAD(P)-dependent dehydrogenase (short-subunit alcohol dehydrogenase family)